MPRYDLSKDTGEENNLAADFPEVVAEMEDILDRARTPSEVFKFGKSK